MQGLPLLCTAFLLAREKTKVLQFRVAFEVPTKQLTSKADNILVINRDHSESDCLQVKHILL